MSVKISLPLEFFGALRTAGHGNARMRVLSLGVVSFQMGLPIVTPLEKLAADFAFVGRFFWCRPLAFLLDTGHTGKNRLDIESL